MNKLGSNQYKIIPRNNHVLGWACGAYLVYLAAGFTAQALSQGITSPCQDFDKCAEKVKVVSLVKTVYASEEKSELQQIVTYIVQKFEPYGRNVAVKALSCFISESSLNPNAYAWNDWNKTADVGIGQINDIHGLSVEERKDWKRNIDKSLELFLSHNKTFSPWYGKGCK